MSKLVGRKDLHGPVVVHDKDVEEEAPCGKVTVADGQAQALSTQWSP
jgi:hypothetical protein